MTVAFINSERYRYLRYSGDHPLKLSSFALTGELINACGLLDGKAAAAIESPLASEKEVLRFHTEEYANALKRANNGDYFEGALDYGLDFRDCPIFKGVYEWALLYTGGTMEAVRLVEESTYASAFSLAGGLHHAGPSRASGFCYLNDPVVAIQYLAEKGRRVAYLDLDAHHADGVQDAFYTTPQVFTISLHEDGRCLFPGTGFPNEIGEGEGRGYNLNIPFYAYATEEIFLDAFEHFAMPLVKRFEPDFLITQAGVDTFQRDPMANLLLTTNTYVKMLEDQKALGKPWVVLGGGGYNRENVVRGWTLAVAAMAGVDLPDALPEEFIKAFPEEEVSKMTLRDPVYKEILAKEKDKKQNQIQKRIALAQNEWEKTRSELEKILPQMVPL